MYDMYVYTTLGVRIGHLFQQHAIPKEVFFDSVSGLVINSEMISLLIV